MSNWKLSNGSDRRIRAQHPWVFANELAASPKGLVPGTPVRLLDHKGQFVASGYGNPNSQIVFRALSFDPNVINPCSMEDIISQVFSAWGHRSVLGYKNSFRMVYGEGDYLPGLVIDRYLIENEAGTQAQVFSVQILTAGMHFSLGASPQMLLRFFERVCEEAKHGNLTNLDFADTAVVVRNDVQVRKLEGLEVEDGIAIKQVEGFNLNAADILIDPALSSEEKAIRMRCDLVQGQKTGFFLDQAHNIALVCEQLRKAKGSLSTPVRILDLCCYVGQWSTQLSHVLSAMGVKAEVTLVDISATALEFAKLNVERQGALALVQKLDVIDGLGTLPDKHYDIVIADPPAFIKAKKDVPNGRHAYMKMNSNAFRLVKRGGWVVSCSCSGLFVEQEFMETLAKSLRRMNLQARCLCRGGHAADHPNLMSFPEGFYLKMFLHQVHY